MSPLRNTHRSASLATAQSASTTSETGLIDTQTRRKVVMASFIGNFVEWFDYAAYGYLAVTIAAVFFPTEDPKASLLMTFGVFAISFLVRPVGGFIWGHLGDKIGRRSALSLSILLMTGATFCIAFFAGLCVNWFHCSVIASVASCGPRLLSRR